MKGGITREKHHLIEKSRNVAPCLVCPKEVSDEIRATENSDYLSTVALSHNPVLHSHTKHMELDIFFVREKVLNRSLAVTHVPAQDQIADVLTKPLSRTRFVYLRAKFKLLIIINNPEFVGGV